MEILGDLFTFGVPVLEKVVRTVIVYGFLVLGLRLFGKRELGQLNPLDFIVLLLLSNTVQNAIIGNDNSLVGGLLGAAVLFLINDGLVRYAYRHPRLRRMIEGRPEDLIREGKVLRPALAHNLVTMEELVAAARKQGIQDIHDIDHCRLEVSGALSFTQKEPSTSERFREQVLERLTAIEKRLPAASALLLVALLPALPLRAQARPSTDVWVVPMHEMGSTIHFGEPVNLTKRTGYDNQPSFTSDGKTVLYTAIGDDGRADSWKVPVEGGKPQRITHIDKSAYSPTVTPDGNSFSIIRVEPDSTQRLWRVPLRGEAGPSLVLDRVKPVGYHVWAGDHQLVLFVLGSPATLQIADERTGKSEIVARDIGRALAKVPGRSAVTFLQQQRGAAPYIAEVDVLTKTVRRIAEPPKGADYHLWTPNGLLVAGGGSELLVWADGKWTGIADFAPFHVRGISRLAVSPKGDWLAFVAEDQPAR
jgi:uncharacterized membrane protein YcaP (DUF421 family)